MKFKSKPVKVEQPPVALVDNLPPQQQLRLSNQVFQGTLNASTEASIAAAVRSLSPIPPTSFMQKSPATTTSSGSPTRSCDEDSSGVATSPSQPQHHQQGLLTAKQPTTSPSQQQQSHGCTMCNKKFSRADILRKHVKTHVTSACTVCGQMFHDKMALAKHQIEAHTLDRVFQCPQCEKGFKELRTLRLHLKIHNAEYPEQCGVCQKVFRTKWQLKQHQMDHGGERPYPCPECSFTCKTKQQLNEHRRKHSGEKAYSCAQCGTRFTYRNGLIKHTKLNRCPKKIITADGETIIKKRSRSVQSHNKAAAKDTDQVKSEQSPHSSPSSSIPLTSPPAAPLPPPTPSSVVTSTQQLQLGDKSNVDKKLLDVIRRRSAMKSQQQQQLVQQSPEPTTTQDGSTIHVYGHGDTFGLALLEDGSLVATTNTTEASTTGKLSVGAIAALSAATGLPASEICTWAASLPAGSTVRVTHHFDTASKQTAASVARLLAAARTTSCSKAEPLHQESVPSSILAKPALDLAAPQQDSLISSCVGLPSYQESFAVDPNEILRKDRCSASRLAMSRSPSVTSFNNVNNNNEDFMDFMTGSNSCSSSDDDLTNNHSNTMEVDEDPLSSMVSEDYNPLSMIQQQGSPCVINSANSRLLSRHIVLPTSKSEKELHVNVKLEPFEQQQGFGGSVAGSPSVASPMSSSSSSSPNSFPLMSPPNCFLQQSNQQFRQQQQQQQQQQQNYIMPDFDLDLPEILDDVDVSGFTLNDQDFNSIKSIVEQTFKDGRDVLDIISAV